MEIKRLMKTHQIIRLCTECDGEMKFTGKIYCIFHIHVCNCCGYIDMFAIKYPHMEFTEDYTRKGD